MNTFEKAKILGDAGQYDTCGPKSCEVKVRDSLGGIYHAKAENKTCRLFKTLMSNSCSFDCKYCPNAKNSSKNKAEYKPEELASLFMHLVKNLAVEGLFLSSGVASDPDRITEKMLQSVKLLRYKEKFKGYIHFKVLPGTSYDLIKQASELSTRLSINLEAPNKNILSELSSCKDYKTDILRRQSWISGMKIGQTTQMIINSISTDKDIIKMSGWEYKNMDLKRVFYSRFRPVKGTPLQDQKEEPLIRQNHLYNVDFLMRQYGFKINEFTQIMDGGMLPDIDPKVALAREYFDSALDINEADYNDLIRIPGIGPKTAQKIVDIRQSKKIEKTRDFINLRIPINKAAPFIKINGYRQKMLQEFCS